MMFLLPYHPGLFLPVRDVTLLLQDPGTIRVVQVFQTIVVGFVKP